MVWKGHIMSVSVIGLRSPHLKNEVSYTDLPWSTYLAWRKLKTTWALVLSKTASRAKLRPIYSRIFWAIVSCESISINISQDISRVYCICMYLPPLPGVVLDHHMSPRSTVEKVINLDISGMMLARLLRLVCCSRPPWCFEPFEPSHRSRKQNHHQWDQSEIDSRWSSWRPN